MSERRSHYISIHFYKGKFSSVHWSPPKECWDREVWGWVAGLRQQVENDLRDGKVTDVPTRLPAE